MDHPSHFHHQHQHQHQNARYAPLPPHLPRHSQFPDDHRLRPHHLPQAPPPPAPTLPAPPLPPALTYRTIRTPHPPHPHPYNPPHQSQFPFKAPNYTHGPVEEERPLSANHPHDFTHSQRVSNRIIVDNDHPRHSLPDFDLCNSDNRIGVWNPHRVLSDNRLSRPYPSVDFERELHHQHPLNHKIAAPYPPVDKLRYDSQGSSRLRVDHIDGYEVKSREELTWGRGDEKYHHRGEFGLNLDASSGDFGIMSSQRTLSRDIDSKTGGYVHLYGVERDNEISRGSRRDGICDSKRWVNDRKAPRDSHNSSFEFGNNENGDSGDGIRITSGKYYGSELGRYNNRGNRESAHEITRTPKKQIQKRSALLRIQMVKPNHRNREIEQIHYTSYANDSNCNSFRGKDQFEYSGYGMKAEEREGSPVELDISFKSNSLVAKAIVAPSSSAIVSDADMTSVSDTDLTPAEKRKNGLVSDSDCSDLKPAKPSTVALNPSSSPCKSNGIRCSGKDLQNNVSDSCSQPCSNATDNRRGKNEGAQTPKGIVSGEITNIHPGKTSPRVAKKKKIVKKVVKKVVSNPNLNVSSAISSNMLDKTMQVDSVTLCPSFTSGSDKYETSLKEKITAVGKVSMPDCLQYSPRKVHLLPDDRKDIPLLSMETHTMSQEYKTNDNSEIGQVARIERSENVSNSPLGACSVKDEKSDSDCLDADNFVLALQTVPNTDKVAKSPNGSTFSDISNIDDVNKQLCRNEVFLSPEQYSNVQCLENRYHVEDDKNCRLSSSAESVNNTDVINTSNSANVRVAGLSFTGNAQEKVAVCDIRNDGKADCKSKALALTENAILEENPETYIPVPSCGMVGLFSLGETRIQDGRDCLKHSRVPMHGYDDGPTNSEDNMTVPHGVIVKDNGRQAFPLDVTISPGNCTTEPFPNAKLSERFDGDTIKSKKRKVGTNLNFSSANKGGIFPDPLQTVSFANVDTTLSLLNDPSPSEVSDPVVQSSELSLQCSMGGLTVLHEKGEVSEAKVYFGNNGNNSSNRASPVSKINEITTSHLNFNLCQAELCDAIVVATPCAEVPISISNNQTHQKEVAFSSIAKLSTSSSLSYPEDSAKLSDKSLVGGSIESMVTKKSECSEMQHPGIDFYSLQEELAIPNDQFSELEGDQKENGTAVVLINNTQKDILVVGNTEREKIDIQAVEKREFRDIVQKSLSADLESSDFQTKDDLPHEHDCLSYPADTGGVTISNSNALSDMFSSGTSSDIPDRRILDCPAIHNENIPGDEENVDSCLMVEHGSYLPDSALSSQHTIENMKTDHATGRNNLIMGKIMPQPLQVYSKVMTKGLNSSCSDGGKNQPGCAIPTTIQGRSYFVFPKSKTSALSTPLSKLRTWHRTGNNSASLPGSKPLAGFVHPKRPISEKKGHFQNASYIRKGNNSLVRKHTSVSALPQGSVNRSSSLGFDEFHFRKSTGFESKVDITEQTNLLKTGITNTSPEGRRTPPLPVDTKLPNQTTASLEENQSSLLIEPLSNADCDSASEPGKFMEPYDALNSAEDALKSYETVENQIGPSNNGESQVEANDGNMSYLNSKRIVYVKRKSNQLVATSNSCDLSVTADDNTQTASSDGYYKRSKNQLVRTTFESPINQTVAMPIVAVNTDGQGTHKAVCNRRFSKRRSHKVARTACKPLRASLVWTLCGANSSKNGSGSVHHQKVLPHLFPWKRATYLRNFIHNPALSSNTSSLSAISKKLVLLRKRDTVYTRSNHGFSLRKSKVLGVGGSSLKWSKSIEKCSKKANEEATLAVAAVERKKREQKDVACISSRSKRERIFRIGSVRYRMDPSGRTLHRISDDESLSSASIHSGLPAKRSYIPRRLVIGNDEYVRIGNGHQLIRDPKKRIRILANEKIRWSLHTARQRLARKQKYCQFFTRFGKCNKDDNKCPYIHDPSKIAVCTKFLNGLCSTPNCKLTHKVIPERMPDCSYFLQGLCTNRSCPYRHVNVNAKASICEGFLRGYCADGNECRKKHTYVCPSFEATGICIQGTKCKLHHPQKQSKGRKRKRYGDQKNSRGRYFGSVRIDVSEPGTMVAPRQGEQNDDDLEGELADYISLDVIDEEVAESIGQPSKQATFSDSEPLDIQMDDLDELIKPVLVMKNDFRAQASPV